MELQSGASQNSLGPQVSPSGLHILGGGSPVLDSPSESVVDPTVVPVPSLVLVDSALLSVASSVVVLVVVDSLVSPLVDAVVGGGVEVVESPGVVADVESLAWVEPESDSPSPPDVSKHPPIARRSTQVNEARSCIPVSSARTAAETMGGYAVTR